MKLLSAVLIVVALFAVSALAQEGSSKWQTGTIIAVSPHEDSKNQDKTQYDISVKVDEMVYVVLYTAPTGSTTPMYRVGVSGPVLIEQDTMTSNDVMGRTNKMPILRREKG